MNDYMELSNADKEHLICIMNHIVAKVILEIQQFTRNRGVYLDIDSKTQSERFN